MRFRFKCAALLLVGSVLTGAGCSAFRPLLFWRDPLIMGETQLVDADGTPVAGAPPAGVVVNFINRDGRIEDTLLSVKTDASGEFTSPVLEPGEYTVEAMMPGFAIESQTVAVRSHEYKYVDFMLKKIREQAGRSMREAAEDNIPHPGEVQIRPPSF